MHKLRKFPSEYISLPLREKAFVIASIQVKLKNDKKLEGKGKKGKKGRRR